MKSKFLFLFLLIAITGSAQKLFAPGNFKKGAVVQDAYGTHWQALKDINNAVSPPSSGALWRYVKNVPVVSNDSLSKQIISLKDRVEDLETVVEDSAIKDPVVVKPPTSLKPAIYASAYLAPIPGTGLQTAAFQAAANAAKGKRLILPDNYIIRIRRVNFPDSIDIVGGVNSVIGTDASAPDHTILFSFDGKHDFSIDNVKFDLGNVSNGNIFNGVMPISLENSYNITLTNLFGQNNKFGFIRFYNVHDVRVTNCTGINMDSPFIHSGNTYNVWHTLNVADGGSSEGFTTAPMFPGQVLRNIYFDRCTVRNKFNSWAFGMHGMQDSWMKNCVVENSRYAVGLSVRPPVEVPTAEDQTGNNILITNCVFKNILGDGIQGQANNTTIIFNEFTNIAGSGINMTRTLEFLPAKDTMTVTNMQIVFNTFTGIAQNVAAGGTSGIFIRRLRNSIIKGNKILTNQKAVHAYGVKLEHIGANVLLEQNEVLDNTIHWYGGTVPTQLRLISNKYKGLENFPVSTNIIFSGNTIL